MTETLVETLMSNAGHPMNRERRAVLRVLLSASGPMDREAVWKAARLQDREIARSTANGALLRFEEVGVVERVRQGRKSLFALRGAQETRPSPAAAPSPAGGQEANGAVVADALKQHGRIMNKTRRAVLETLMIADRAMDVDEVWRILCAQELNTSYSSVIRTLRIFHELGVVEVSARRGQRRLFKLRAKTRSLSLVLPNGTEVQEVEAEELIQGIEQYLAAKGFELSDGVYFSVRPTAPAEPHGPGPSSGGRPAGPSRRPSPTPLSQNRRRSSARHPGSGRAAPLADVLRGAPKGPRSM